MVNERSMNKYKNNSGASPRPSYLKTLENTNSVLCFIENYIYFEQYWFLR